MKKSKKSKAIGIISGGLDSTIALHKAKNKYHIPYCIFFNYGQKSYKYEKHACIKLSRKLKFKLIEIDISFISDFSKSSLTKQKKAIPRLRKKDLQNKKLLISTAHNVMVQNRNMIFISIAAGIAVELKCNKLITGFNKEEARAFPDNSKTFMKSINKTLQISLKPYKIKVISPTINMTKKQMINFAIKNRINLSTIYSCYTGRKKMCGKCESCIRLKNALEGINPKTLGINL